MNGTALENAPFEAVFRDVESAHRFQRHLPVQVQSCWNGIAVLDPAPLYAHPHVRFRMAKLSAGECSASECSLICNDYWNAGYGRIIMISRVKLAYDKVGFRASLLLLPSRPDSDLVFLSTNSKSGTSSTPSVAISPTSEATLDWEAIPTTLTRTLKIARGMDRTIVSSGKRRAKPSTSGHHRRMVRLPFRLSSPHSLKC
jgi:hypothetical protein